MKPVSTLTRLEKAVAGMAILMGLAPPLVLLDLVVFGNHGPVGWLLARPMFEKLGPFMARDLAGMATGVCLTGSLFLAPFLRRNPSPAHAKLSVGAFFLAASSAFLCGLFSALGGR